MPSGTNVTITIKKDDDTSAKKTFAVYNGHSAYEIWLMAGNVGDKDDFLASLKGEKGDMGPRGPAGFAQYAVEAGNFSSDYGPDLSDDAAHGHMGTCEYWKQTVPLRKAPPSTNIPVHCTVSEVPCGSGGEMLAYTLYTNYKRAQTATLLTVVMMVFGDATQTLDLGTGKYTPLSKTGAGTELRYEITYWY